MYNLLDPDYPVVNITPNPASSYMQATLSSSWKQLIDRSRLFLAPVRIISSSYEGTNGLNATKEFLAYKNGNILEYLDRGENTDDAFKTVIEYHTSVGSLTNSTGFPKKVSVYKKGNAIADNLMRQRESQYNSLGKLSKVTTKLNSLENRIVDLEYDTYGNLKKFIDTDNKNASNVSYSVTLTYDDVVKTYPVMTENGFGEQSTATYNYLFGIPVLNIDVNGHKMRTRIDDCGRVIEVTGPNEIDNPNGWTIRTQYEGENPTFPTNAEDYTVR